MALLKIYLGNILIMDTPSIAAAIGSEAASATNCGDIVNIINNDKILIADNLTSKNVSASSSETLSSLAAKIYNVPVNDPTPIAQAIGTEIPSNSSITTIANTITADKGTLVGYLNLYGLTGQVATTTLSTLLAQLGNINATRYYFASDTLDLSGFASVLQTFMTNMTDTTITDLLTPTAPVASEDLTAGLTITDSLTDTPSSTIYTVLTNQMLSNSTSNAPPVFSDLIPAMGANTSATGTASASSNYNSGNGIYSSYKPFDWNLSGCYDGTGGWVSILNTVTGWLQFQFGTAQIVKQYNVVGWRNDSSLATVTGSFPKNWTFLGSNDGNNWDTLDTQTNQTITTQAQVKTYVIANTTAYTYYKLNITANNGNTSYVTVGQLVLLANTPTTPVGTVSSSSIYSSSYDAWKAFNQSYASDDCWLTVNNTLTGWIRYQSNIARIVNCYEVYSRNEASTGANSFPKNWTFEGSNNGTDWSVLDTQTNQSVILYSYYKSYTIANTTAYTYYRLNITANNGNTSYTSVGELRLLSI